MSRIRRHFLCILTVWSTLTIAGIGGVVRAQDDVVIEEERAAPVEVVVTRFKGEIIDQWLFSGRLGNRTLVRDDLDWALKARVNEIEESCGLTTAQKQKLQLAGSADIKRFFDRVDETKRQVEGMNKNQNNVMHDLIPPLAIELQSGLFGDRSLFAKTIKRTLSADQAAQRERYVHQQKLFRYEATIAWYVVQLDKSLGLSDEQRERLTKLLVKETHPPKRYDRGVNWFVLLQASNIPESRIKPILNDIQWKMFSRQLVQARKLEEWLKGNGVVVDDELAGVQSINP
jgi:hypothetical protein